MKKIEVRTNQRIRFEAGLHGIHLEAKEESITPVSLTEKQQSDMDAALERAIARKMKEGSNG